MARNGLAMVVCGWLSWVYAEQAGRVLVRHIPALGLDPWVSFIAGALAIFTASTLIYHRIVYHLIDWPLIPEVSETPIEDGGWHFSARVHTPQLARWLHTLAALGFNLPVLHYLYDGHPRSLLLAPVLIITFRAVLRRRFTITIMPETVRFQGLTKGEIPFNACQIALIPHEEKAAAEVRPNPARSTEPEYWYQDSRFIALIENAHLRHDLIDIYGMRNSQNLYGRLAEKFEAMKQTEDIWR